MPPTDVPAMCVFVRSYFMNTQCHKPTCAIRVENKCTSADHDPGVICAVDLNKRLEQHDVSLTKGQVSSLFGRLACLPPIQYCSLSPLCVTHIRCLCCECILTSIIVPCCLRRPLRVSATTATATSTSLVSLRTWRANSIRTRTDSRTACARCSRRSSPPCEPLCK